MQSGQRRYPYISFDNFLMGMARLRVHPVERIDASCWSDSRVLTEKANELLAALQFLGFMTSDGRPTAELAKALEPKTEQAAFRAALARAYAIDLGTLRTMTMKQAEDRFYAMCMSKYLWKKIRSFYLKAAKHAGVEMGQLMPRERKKPKTAGRKPPKVEESVHPELRIVARCCGKASGGGEYVLCLRNGTPEDLTAEDHARISRAMAELGESAHASAR